ncbi:kinase-like protein [Patellaria atrata CBS 101060]|uniref:non-specific serine/threonine protein kinase n=1 Tax=Patellaria atrata CBS 101060 TaxID=1346257 RepID=A0A9P4VQI0_9PEZI|nr:kinase-like protein [Patellaria atrata CBS 101060]
MTDEDKYEVLEKIGHGSFGIIRKVRRKSDGYILCRKEISYVRMSQKEREQLHAELSILKELRHPNIVAYYEREHLKASQDLHLYMEYCGNGDLGQLIKNLKVKNQYAEEAFVWNVFSQLVTALYRCHYGENAPEPGARIMGLGNNAKPSKKNVNYMILHRDLKPENVFLGEDNSVKLGDFGLSKILASHDFASTYVGTPFYMSPEICQAERYTLQSDIWSLGCIIYELCVKEPPFNARTHLELVQKIRAGRVDRKLPSCYSQELQKVVDSCLKVDSRSRPDTAQLLNLPIVKLMRKEEEVVRLGQKLKKDQEVAETMIREANEKVGRFETEKEMIREQVTKEIDAMLRREWEVKARLEIDRQVSAEVERLRKMFDTELSKRLAEETEKIKASMATEPEQPERSSTPTHDYLHPGASTSTSGEPSDCPSTTDLSELSLDSPVIRQAKPPKRSTRTPFARAQTMFAAQVAPSPMDVHMSSPSPVSKSIAGLSLSPRRHEGERGETSSDLFQQPPPRLAARNIFAAANAPERKWEPTNASDVDGLDADVEDDDDDILPALPSPTRIKMENDPFKVLATTRPGFSRQKTLPQRLGSTPHLFAPSSQQVAAPRMKQQSVVPVVSPGRRKNKTLGPVEATSPTRKELLKPRQGNAFKSKVGMLDKDPMLRAAMRNNQVQGRTLIELAQARTASSISQDHVDSDTEKKSFGSVGKEIGFAANVATWDPETDEMPSPFLKRTRDMRTIVR